MKYLILLLSIIVFSLLLSCEDEKITNPKPDVVKFDTVKICNQVWMTKNLDVDHYRNGDSIPEVKDSTEWANLTTGAWCYYNNDPAMGKIYSKLYNWYAVNDARGLAPEGWHVSTYIDWLVLSDCLGGIPLLGGKLKTTGTIETGDGLWRSPNEGATNSSGFSALPGGERTLIVGDEFHSLGSSGRWWSLYEFDSTKNSNIYYHLNYVAWYSSRKTSGFSVRCVRD